MREAWTAQHAEIEEQAQALLKHVRGLGATADGAPVDDLHAKAVEQLARRFDSAHGGFDTAPKFPQAPLLQYL